jgi:hypothetical protein
MKRKSRRRPAFLLPVLFVGLVMGFSSLDLQAQPTIITTSLPNGTIGEPYSARVSATGGLPPYTWSAAGLPPGLSIALLSGVISGTPTDVGAFSPTVTVRDALLRTSNRQFSLPIVSPLTITTAALPSGTVGTSYSQTLTASGGTPGYNWSIVSGSLPAGLTLSGATISGTPTKAGN